MACVLQGAVWVLRIPALPSWGLPLLFSRWGEAGAWWGEQSPFLLGLSRESCDFSSRGELLSPWGCSDSRAAAGGKRGSDSCGESSCKPSRQRAPEKSLWRGRVATSPCSLPGPLVPLRVLAVTCHV